MKEVFLMAMATITFMFAGCENKRTAPSDDQADTAIMMDASVNVTTDSLTSELGTQLSQSNTDAIQASLTPLQNRYAELVAPDKLDTAKAYAAKIQLFLNDNAEKIKAATANNATTTTLVSGIQNLPTTAEAAAERTEAAVKDNAEEMMKRAEFKTNKAIDEAKQETTKATDNTNARVNEAKDGADEALDKSAEEADREVDQARGQTRKGLRP